MNKLHIYTGEGKGKTTAAMGLALRGLGHGRIVLIGQFVKDGRSGELIALSRFPEAEVLLPEPLHGFVSQMSDAEKAAAVRAQTEYASLLCARIEALRPQTIVLDELGVALALGVLPEESAVRLLDTALRHGETAVTGRFMPSWLLSRADYISRIQSERHPYDTEKLPAREGVEW